MNIFNGMTMNTTRSSQKVAVLQYSDLPKVSLNQWYSGKFWKERQKLKNAYGLLLRRDRHKFKKTATYDVEYEFEFKGRALDASNCGAMAKLIEDVIFEDDKHDIVRSVKYSSRKGTRDFVTVKVSVIQ